MDLDGRLAEVSHGQSVGGQEAGDKLCGVAGVADPPPENL
jgi:hypothetical protein